MADPARAYAARLEARQTERDRLSRRDKALSRLRLILFFTALVLVIAAFGAERVPGWTVALPGAAFVMAVVEHERAAAARRRADRAVTFYRRALDRIEDRWRGQGQDGARFDDEHHPYARDLDLFGKGSLFERLCTARTHAGEETLARWLKTPAPADEVGARQAAVRELTARLDLREDLALLGADVRAELDPARLGRWARAAPIAALAGRPWLPLPLGLLATASLTTLAGWLALDWGWSPFALVLAAQAVAHRLLEGAVGAVAAGVDGPSAQLAVLAQVLARLEREPVTSPRLVALTRALAEGGAPASRTIAHLARLAALLKTQRNQLFAPLGYLLMWTPQLALRIEAWRARAGRAVPGWLDAVGEVEALSALAAYAFENPDDAMPELTEGGPRFEAEGLGHPLLPREGCVRNDVALGETPRLLLVSGSNMSGKSTLLRSVGSAVVLALAGAPVRARALRLSPLQVGATLRVQDSLAEGASRFYAEITRLRQLVDLAGGRPPLLFLLDEILAGTNSHDRRIGAEAVVRGLLTRGAVGLVTTHDLALTEMAAALAPLAANVHFEDALEDGVLRFDYRMREGVVRRSNAIALMRAVGLEV